MDADDGLALTHETWLEAGLKFQTADDCVFCGQYLSDRTLINTYAAVFGAQYKALAGEVRKRRATIQRYIAGDFRRQLLGRLSAITSCCQAWQTLTSVPAIEINADRLEAVITDLEACAGAIDRFFGLKQEDLAEPVGLPDLERELAAWSEGRSVILALNETIDAHRRKLSAVRERYASSNLEAMKSEIAALNARRLRADPAMQAAIASRNEADENKTRYTNERTRLRAELTAYSNKIALSLGQAINAYLSRLGAGFRIDYQQPNYRGKDPAAAYLLLINDVPVPPRSGEDSISEPSFRNTLSTGDKSVLALAFFLASLASDPNLEQTIVVLDDPFTSLDEFRRTFTANEIKKLVRTSKQVIVLSHDKTFLRLLWERIDQNLITSVAVQTGAPGISTLTPFDIASSTLPRHETERTKVLDFLDDTTGDPPENRALLRKVLEHFYRQADPHQFASNAMLEGIVRIIKDAAGDYPYKAAYDDLEAINFYTRNFHHAPVSGSVTEQTPVEELKTYCRIVRDLTRGYV